MPVMAWSPLAGGRLFADEPAAARVRAVLERIARAASADLSAAALAWLLHHPARVLPVVGTTDPKRIGTISQALAVPMDRQTWFEIYEAGLGREVP
jgi:predicted oxidoreductase